MESGIKPSEPGCQNPSSGFLTRPNTNRPVQLQEMARILKFRIICTFVLAKAEFQISHDGAHIFRENL